MHKKDIYLDYAAATPVDPDILRVYTKAVARFANPSSIHSLGSEAKRRLANCREQVAELFGVRSQEVVFTSGATESNNVALQGIVRAARARGVERPHIVTCSIEHDSTKEVLRALEHEGAEVTFLDPNENGILDPRALQKALQSNTVLVVISHVHGELGAVAPVDEYARTLRAFRDESISPYPLLHVDASQSLTVFSGNEITQGADTLSADASKVYGVRGAGLLVVRSDVPIEPILFGGGQERSLRPGTENSAAIVAFAEALRRCQERVSRERERLQGLSELFIRQLRQEVPSARVNSPEDVTGAPHIINICIPGEDAEFLVISLDARDVHVSRGSACKESGPDFSEAVLKTKGEECATSSIRFSLGRSTRKTEIQRAVTTLSALLAKRQ